MKWEVALSENSRLVSVCRRRTESLVQLANFPVAKGGVLPLPQPRLKVI